LFPELPVPCEPAHLDLEEANRRILVAAGVPAARIHAGGLCTRCRAGDFHSYRRDSLLAGRLLAAIGLKV
jgi:copper oxidase (laccase) domain-containing protein